MTNNVVSFDIGGVKGVIDTNTVIKRLAFSSTSTSAASYHTLLDFKNGSAYVVPALQKTRIVFFNNWAPIGSDTKIVYADAQNSGTNAVTLFLGDGTSTLTNFIAITAAAPAGKYINMYRSADPGTKAVDVYAIEELA